MKLVRCKFSRNIVYAVIASGFVWCASPTMAQGTARPQIDGVGTILSSTPGGRPIGPRRLAQFVICGVANEQSMTSQFLAGDFAYVDRRSRISFITSRIETVTINGDQASFTGTARIGGRNKQTVQFTVVVTANRSVPSEHFFSIVLSNGYANSGPLTSGEIVIHDVEPD